jgi:hypothetical protein
VLDVAQQREREVLVLGERAVGRDVVEGRADEMDAQTVEVGGSVTEPLAFERSTPGRGLRKPPQDDPAAALVLQPEAPAAGVRQLEERRRVADLETHVRVHLHCTSTGMVANDALWSRVPAPVTRRC